MGVKIGQHEARLSVGNEGTYGVLGTMTMRIPTESMSFDFKRDSVAQVEFGVARTDTMAYKREEVLIPTLTMSVQPNAVKELFAAHFGQVTTTANLKDSAGTQYLHTFTPTGTISDAFRSVCFKLDYGQGTAYDYVGVRGNNLTLSCAAKENLKLTFEGIGQREIAGTSDAATVLYGTFAPFEFKDCTVTIDGTVEDGVRSLEVTLGNALSEGFRIGTQAYTTRPLPGGRYDAQIKMSVEYNDVNRQRYLGGTNVGISVKFTGPVIGGTGLNELVMNFPKVDFMTAPFEYQDGLMFMAIGGKALEGGTSFAGTSQAVQFKLYNTGTAF